jgi:hypothetical protein
MRVCVHSDSPFRLGERVRANLCLGEMLCTYAGRYCTYAGKYCIEVAAKGMPDTFSHAYLLSKTPV